MENLEQYLTDGMEVLVKDAMRATLKKPKQAAFFLKYGMAIKKSEKSRHHHEKNGEHIPTFLIASITGECNLNCTGCYDRANQECGKQTEMTEAEWKNVFSQAEDIGVSVILLAGGEPLMRRDVIEAAGKHPNLLFPVFTNGTMLNDSYISFFNEHRNIVPIISVEGGEAQTDARRGKGIYAKTMAAIDKLNSQGLMYGTSITVTKENLSTVTDETYIADIQSRNCKIVIYVEYVPIDRQEIALDDDQRDFLAARVQDIRSKNDMIIVSFPGDEKESGGCLAAGRGFFHINSAGGAEPCPFSPYSDTNLKTSTLLEALKSPLFMRLKSSDLLMAEHKGGCTLFDKRDIVLSFTK